MTYPLNPEQIRAVSNFEADLLVTAGAGTGKTSVLVNKYLRLLEERRAKVGEIVAITFTKKAAAEMRERIREEIRARVKAEQDPSFWKTALLELESARIGTFHSFCLGFIREHPLEAGISPATGILGEGETAIFISQAMETMLTEYMKAPEVPAGNQQILMQILLDFGWDGFQSSLSTIYQTLREGGVPFGEVIRRSGEGLAAALANYPVTIDHVIGEIEALLEFSKGVALTERAGEIIAALREEWPDYHESLNGNDLLQEQLPALDGLVKALPKNLPNTIKDRVVLIREMIDQICLRLLDEESLKRLPVFGELLIRLDFHYTRMKQALGNLDFVDQLILARNLLRDNSKTAGEVRAGIRYLLVDEFQDTNGLQMELLQLLCGENYRAGRFMVVGDIKQSIYRFRGAEADLMLKLGVDMEVGQGKQLALTRNYRSAERIIRFVNAVSTAMFQGEPFVYEPLEAGNLQGAAAAIEFILSSDLSGRWNEARMVARRIAQLVAAPAPFTYGDIVLLFRARTAIPVYQKALQEMGIPYYTASGGEFYQCPEVRDQLNLLRITLNRYDGVALLSLLTSPYVGLTDESLLWLAGGGELVRKFYDDADLAPEIDSEERQRLIRFRELLARLQEQREYLGIPGILRIALDDCDYWETLWAFPDAGQRLANLEKLLAKADEFVAKGFHDLRRFLTYIEELEAAEVIEGEAPTQLETGNVVRLMTIHRAKGLEFPVVFLPDLDRQFKRSMASGRRVQRISYHKAVGLSFGIKYGENETGYGTVGERIKRLNRREELAELKRLLYVALTRAKQQLILAGSGQSKSKATGIEEADSWMKWFQLLLPLQDTGPVMEFEGIPIRITRELPESEGRVAANCCLDIYVSQIPGVTPVSTPAAQEVAAAVYVPAKFKASFKVTELLAYKECPRLYFWRHRLGLEETHHQGAAKDKDLRLEVAAQEPPDIGVRIGKFIHQTVRLTGPDWPEGLWSASFSDVDRAVKAKLKDDLLGMWHNFRNSPFIEETGTFWDEVPFKVRLQENVFVEGRFDRLLRDRDGKLTLVDYKTHRTGAERAAEVATGYFWQLQLYALAVEALWGQLPDQAILYFVYPDRKVEVPLQRELLEQTKRDVVAMAEFSGTHFRVEDYEARASAHGKKCGGCGYREYCFSFSY